ncbi:MAG: carboxypeptidase-like regulatory domain-containing protein, partial [Gemmatimonadales bacterium]
MSSQSKSMRLRFVVTMCMVLAGGAVSMGTSCITAPKGKTASGASTGTINGVVDSSNNSPIGAGLSVTATDGATGTQVTGNTAADGSYSLTDVPAGSGTLTVGPFGSASGCSAPAATNYTMTKGGTLTENIKVPCLV